MVKLTKLGRARDSVLSNPLAYILIGAIVAIVVSRIYVFLGGFTSLTIDGVTFHHFFGGVALMAVVGILSFFLNDRARGSGIIRRVLALLFGIGMGFVIDEANLFLIGGQNYTLGQYYVPADIFTEFVIVAILFAALILTTLFGPHGRIGNLSREKLRK